jgi:hypothetical protein
MRIVQGAVQYGTVQNSMRDSENMKACTNHAMEEERETRQAGCQIAATDRHSHSHFLS